MNEEREEQLRAPGGRMEIGGVGAGEFSAATIEQRARELAHTEGRDEVSEADRARALEELSGPAPELGAPEAVIPEIEQLVAWDGAADSSGHRVEPVGLPDETSIGEQLVQEGLDEADHQRRVSAVDEQDEADRIE